MTSPIDIRIDGVPQSPDSVGVSPMNFGLFGHYTGGLPVQRYEIGVASEDFVARAGDLIAEFVADCKRDDARHGGLEIPCIVALKYPGMSTLLDNPACLAELVTECLPTETLYALLGDPTADKPAYILHSLDALTVDTGFIRLGGAALNATV